MDDRTHTGKVVIAELARQLDPERFLIEERVFQDAWIVGPAVLIPIRNTQFHDNLFPDLPLDAWLWTMPEAGAVGCVGVADCLFQRCDFQHITLMGDLDFIRRMKEDLENH